MKAFFELLFDVWEFLNVRKKYWLGPLIITIILVSAIIVITQGTVLSPFIYSIF